MTYIAISLVVQMMPLQGHNSGWIFCSCSPKKILVNLSFFSTKILKPEDAFFKKYSIQCEWLISELLRASVSKRVLLHTHSDGNEYRILMQIISLTIVEHQDSLRNRDKQQLGNGQLLISPSIFDANGWRIERSEKELPSNSVLLFV